MNVTFEARTIPDVELSSGPVADVPRYTTEEHVFTDVQVLMATLVYHRPRYTPVHPTLMMKFRW